MNIFNTYKRSNSSFVSLPDLKRVLLDYDDKDDPNASCVKHSDLLKLIGNQALMIKDQDDQIKRLQRIMTLAVGMPKKEPIGLCDEFNGQNCFMAGEKIEPGDFVYIKKGYVYLQIKKG